MQWLVSLEAEPDIILVCRLANIFRRKGLSVLTLTLATRPAALDFLALVESPESELDHIFNYLRRTVGVRHVTCYRQETAGKASFVFIDQDDKTSSVARVVRSFPEAKLIFANQGRYLLEIPAEADSLGISLREDRPEFLPLTPVKTTRTGPCPELVSAEAP